MSICWSAAIGRFRLLPPAGDMMVGALFGVWDFLFLQVYPPGRVNKYGKDLFKKLEFENSRNAIRN